MESVFLQLQLLQVTGNVPTSLITIQMMRWGRDATPQHGRLWVRHGWRRTAYGAHAPSLNAVDVSGGAADLMTQHVPGLCEQMCGAHTIAGTGLQRTAWRQTMAADAHASLGAAVWHGWKSPNLQWQAIVTAVYRQPIAQLHAARSRMQTVASACRKRLRRRRGAGMPIAQISRGGPSASLCTSASRYIYRTAASSGAANRACSEGPAAKGRLARLCGKPLSS